MLKLAALLVDFMDLKCHRQRDGTKLNSELQNITSKNFMDFMELGNI